MSNPLPLYNSTNVTESPFFNSTTLSMSGVWERYPSWKSFFKEYSPSMVVFREYLPIIWYILGCPGNILAFITWIQPRLRTSSGLYFAGVAVTDLILLLIKISKTIQHQYRYHVNNIHGICQILKVCDYTLQYLHPLLILGFTTERWIAICYPFKRAKFCTKTRALKAILSLFCIALSLAVPQAYFWHIDSSGYCNYRESVIKAGFKSVFSIWTWITEIMVFILVPVAALVFNICVIKYIKHVRQSKGVHAQVMRVHSSKTHKCTTTFTLLATSFFNIFTELAVTLVYIFFPLFKHGEENFSDEEVRADPTWRAFITYKSIEYAVYNICLSRYALNFYIYLATGKTFREELKRLLCFKTIKKRKASVQETKWLYTSDL